MSDFRALHQIGNHFILANAWDVGSAKFLAAMGAKAIATSSSAHGYTLGLPDMGHMTRDQALAHAQDLVSAVNVPVSGDFEDGFGADPDTVAETVRLAAEVGLAGICIEDTELPSTHPYDFDLAVERIAAGAAAARALGTDFVFVARADGFMNECYDLDEAIKRLQAFEAAGADVLYAPRLASLADQEKVCKSVSLPVNALTTGELTKVTLAEFASVGVARVSLGGTLSRAYHTSVANMARAMFDEGDFSRLSGAMSGGEIEKLLKAGGR